MEKLAILAASARYDASCASSGSQRRPPGFADGAGSPRGIGRPGGIGATLPAGVCHSFAGDGRCVSLLKLLFSNSCRFDCAYCANRASVDQRRTSFSVDELVRLTTAFYRRNYIEGLFLSSGIFSDSDIVMGKLIEVAKTLRQKEKFAGYIHLKAIPGCTDAQLREAGLWADRLSANIELPTMSSLARLAPQKSGSEILGAMKRMHSMTEETARDEERRRRNPLLRPVPSFAPAGQSTQLVVGASPDDDASILRLAGSLYSRYGMRRVYYSAYIPVSRDPRLPAAAAPPLRREHRLYQADWLLRFYGFDMREIIEPGTGNLSSSLDPKTAWALRHPEFFPVDLRTASYEKILRVPGIGLTGARRIVSTRRSAALRAEDLPKIGIVLKRARWFISLGGRPVELPVDFERLALHLAEADPHSAGVSAIDAAASMADWAAGSGPAQAPRRPAGSQQEFSFA